MLYDEYPEGHDAFFRVFSYACMLRFNSFMALMSDIYACILMDVAGR